MNMFMRLWRQEEAQGLTEYALLLATVVIVAGVVLLVFGNKITGMFNGISLPVPAVS